MLHVSRTTEKERENLVILGRRVFASLEQESRISGRRDKAESIVRREKSKVGPKPQLDTCLRESDVSADVISFPYDVEELQVQRGLVVQHKGSPDPLTVQL